MDGLPLSFGKKAPPKKQNVKQKLDETRRGDADVGGSEKEKGNTAGKKRAFEEVDASVSVPEPKNEGFNNVGGADGGEGDDDDDDDVETEEQDDMPVSHEIVLKDHSKVRPLLIPLK